MFADDLEPDWRDKMYDDDLMSIGFSQRLETSEGIVYDNNFDQPLYTSY
jgi:hypothetical protein